MLTLDGFASSMNYKVQPHQGRLSPRHPEGPRPSQRGTAFPQSTAAGLPLAGALGMLGCFRVLAQSDAGYIGCFDLRSHPAERNSTEQGSLLPGSIPPTHCSDAPCSWQCAVQQRGVKALRAAVLTPSSGDVRWGRLSNLLQDDDALRDILQQITRPGHL